MGRRTPRGSSLWDAAAGGSSHSFVCVRTHFPNWSIYVRIRHVVINAFRIPLLMMTIAPALDHARGQMVAGWIGPGMKSTQPDLSTGGRRVWWHRW